WHPPVHDPALDLMNRITPLRNLAAIVTKPIDRKQIKDRSPIGSHCISATAGETCHGVLSETWAMAAPALSPRAAMVREGASPPPELGNTLASQMKTFRQRWLRQSASTTERSGSWPIRQVPKTCVELKTS